MPFFQEVSKIALMKYQHYFSEQSFIRGQKVMREGEAVTHLHVVIEGEFELSKQVKFVAKNADNTRNNKFDLMLNFSKIHCNSLLGPPDHKITKSKRRARTKHHDFLFSRVYRHPWIPMDIQAYSWNT